MTKKERLQIILFEFSVLSETIGKLHCAKYMVDGDELCRIIEKLEDAMARRDAMQKDIVNLIRHSNDK